jgi:hypothetical protein
VTAPDSRSDSEQFQIFSTQIKRPGLSFAAVQACANLPFYPVSNQF